MKKTELRKYASLIARVGGGVKKGDNVIIVAELDQPEFVEMLAVECYRAGAKKVTVEWSHQPLARISNRYQSLTTLSSLADWEIEKWKDRAEKLPVMLYLESEDPDGLAGINQEKNAKAIQAKMKYIKPIRDTMECRYKWCIAAVPGVKWAKKMFPKLRQNQAVEALWQAIFETVRMCDDPIAAWDEHNRDLAARCEHLNSLGIESLHYTASNGTDLTVGMIPRCLFMGGGEYTLGGEYFNPNMPTEETFITPMKGKADGIVYATKPLSYRGELIENFSIVFKDGKAVEVHAERGEDLLREMIGMDEGAAYLGECALVPYDSPINNTGLLFYNTLFDENASCHLALGTGFPNCLADYADMTLDEAHEKGINDSMIHVDFMIGTKDLSITAKTADGREIPVFRDGGWAF